MRILVPAISSATRTDGVTRHAINLACCLLLEPSVTQVDLVIGPWQQPYIQSLLGTLDSRLRLHIEPIQSSPLARNLWYYTSLPRLAKALHSDLVHVTYPVPLNRRRIPCPVVVTLHDLYPYDIPENFGYPRVFLYRLILEQCLSAADAIACVSTSTLKRLGAHRPSLKQKSTRIYNCLESVSVESQAPAPHGPITEHPFLLTVAQHRRNKNIPLTLAVFRRLIETPLTRHPDLLLLLVGNEGPETPMLRTLLEDEPFQSRVVLLSGISDQQLQWCYRHAELFLSTSSLEGFGLPIAEAMSAGCPVVCSDIPVFRELGEGLSSLVSLGAHAEERFVHVIEGVLDQPRPRPMLFPQLAPLAIAERYVQLYRDLLAAHPMYSTAPLQFEDQKGGLA
jgi:glycosyltransferase involved in cell wall biosynthesis